MPFVSHEKIIEDKKIEYYKALNKSQVSWKKEIEDLIPRFSFFLEVVNGQASKALELNTTQYIEYQLSSSQLKVRELIQQRKSITRKEVHEITKIPYSTVGQILNKLIDMKLIEKKGNRRGVIYCICEI